MKKTGYTINYAEKEIIITKEFERRAGIYGSEAYNTLKGLRSDLPDYTVKQKEIAKSSAKKTYSNLNYTNMELYITITDGVDSENLKVFETIKKASKIQPSPYAFWVISFIPPPFLFGSCGLLPARNNSVRRYFTLICFIYFIYIIYFYIGGAVSLVRIFGWRGLL